MKLYLWLWYANNGESSIDGLTVVGPVPEGASNLSNTASAGSAAALPVSIDGGMTYGSAPVIRLEIKASGEVVEQVVLPEEYTYLNRQANNALNRSITIAGFLI